MPGLVIQQDAKQTDTDRMVGCIDTVPLGLKGRDGTNVKETIGPP